VVPDHHPVRGRRAKGAPGEEGMDHLTRLSFSKVLVDHLLDLVRFAVAIYCSVVKTSLM
jgi:hypothetical protein